MNRYLFFLASFLFLHGASLAAPVMGTLNSAREPQKLCVSILVEEPEIKVAFLEGAKKAYEKRQAPSGTPYRLQHHEPKYELSLQYGYAGLMNCLNPQKNFDRVFILAHSILTSENTSAIVYFQNIRTLSGDIKPYPYLVSEELLLKIKNFPQKKPLFIATCYSHGLEQNYPGLFPINQLSGPTDLTYLSESDAVAPSGKMLRLTSVESALKLFAQFLDFR